MSQPPVPVKQRTSHPIWRGLLCLVLGLGAWWGVVKWLEPRPTWTKVLSGKSNALIPLVDDRSKNMLVCLEANSGNKTDALVIFSLDRGEELYRTSIQRSHSSELYYSETWRPRIVEKQLCWLDEVQPQDRFDSRDRPIELRVWNYQDGEQHRAVQTWQIPKGLHPRFYFHSKSRVVVVKQTFPIQSLIAMNSQSLGMSIMACYDWPRLIRWYETWSVPQSPGEPVKLLARWSPPMDRWHREISLSEDGRWAAFAETTNSYATIVRKARATGLKEFNSDELFKLYHGESSGVLVFDTTTGKQSHQLSVPGKEVGSVHWARDILCTYVEGFPKEFSLTLKEIEESGKREGHESRQYLEFGNQHYLLKDKTLTLVSCPEGCAEHLSDLQMVNGTLTLFDDEHQLIHEVALQADRLVIQHSLADSEGHDGRNFWWVRDSGQSVSSAKTPRPEIVFLREWAERWPVLTTLADWLDKDSKPRLSIQGPRYETTLSLKPYQEVWNLRVNDFAQLYLWGYATSQPEMKDYTLQAYAFPLKLYSPWWGRGLGLSVFLLTLLLLSWRVRRGGRATV